MRAVVLQQVAVRVQRFVRDCLGRPRLVVELEDRDGPRAALITRRSLTIPAMRLRHPSGRRRARTAALRRLIEQMPDGRSRASSRSASLMLQGRDQCRLLRRAACVGEIEQAALVACAAWCRPSRGRRRWASIGARAASNAPALIRPRHAVLMRCVDAGEVEQAQNGTCSRAATIASIAPCPVPLTRPARSTDCRTNESGTAGHAGC